jgi:4,5-dihydroxyphthalate decarboxylase
MLAEGELAAAIGVDAEDAVPLIPDPEEAALAALRRGGFFPINHLVVVRDDVLAEHPDLAADLFGAFAEAKNRYVEQLRADAVPEPTAADRTYRRVLEATGADPLPYGLEPNRATLEKLLDHALAQHLLTRRPDLESVFAPGTLDLVG